MPPRVAFPRGVIRTVAFYRRHRLPFVRDEVTARNIAYTSQVSDVNQWMLNRFDLGLSAKSLLCM